MRKLSEVLSSTSNSVYLKHHLFLPSTPLFSPTLLLLLLSLLPDHQTPERGKKLVFLTARVHPGESPASFICQGKVLMLRLWLVSLIWCGRSSSLHVTIQRGWCLQGCKAHCYWRPTHGCVHWIQLICCWRDNPGFTINHLQCGLIISNILFMLSLGWNQANFCNSFMLNS